MPTPLHLYTKWYWAGRHAGADATMICPARRAAMWLRAAGEPAFLYHFTHVPGGSSGRYPHLAHHTGEIPFVFHDLEAHGPVADEYFIHGAAEVALSTSMATYWRNFASSGDPNVYARADGRASAAALPTWPAYDSGSDTTMVFQFGAMVRGGRFKPGSKFSLPALVSASCLILSQAQQGVKRAQCDLWDHLYGWDDATTVTAMVQRLKRTPASLYKSYHPEFQ